MLPPGRSRSGRRPATLLTGEEVVEAAAWLREGIEGTKLGINRFLALLGEQGVSTNATRLKKYCLGLKLPEAVTLRAICRVAHLSYVEAVDRFGYYREIVKLFDDLVWLGDRWMEEDDAYGRAIRLDPGPGKVDIDAQGRAVKFGGERISRVDTIHYSGVLHWKGQPITWGQPAPLLGMTGCDPREDDTFLKRYFVGTWVEGMPIMDPNTPEIVREAVRQLNQSSTIVPKPVAVAILLATLTFPRRGDLYKEEAPEYRYALAKAAEPLVDEAIARRSNLRAPGRPKKLHPLLQRASQALDDSIVPFNLRRPIAAEYIVLWADSICQGFTHFARLAEYEVWGEAGGRPPSAPAVAVLQAVPGEMTSATVSFPSVFTQLPRNSTGDSA